MPTPPPPETANPRHDRAGHASTRTRRNLIAIAAGLASVGIPPIITIAVPAHTGQASGHLLHPQWTYLIDGVALRVIPVVALINVALLAWRAARAFVLGVIAAVTFAMLLMVTITLR